LVSPMRRGDSTILACESNMFDLPGEAAKMPDIDRAGSLRSDNLYTI
jgi:hypothetical protein